MSNLLVAKAKVGVSRACLSTRNGIDRRACDPRSRRPCAGASMHDKQEEYAGMLPVSRAVARSCGAAMDDALTWAGLIAGGRPRSESACAGLGASAASAVAPATLLYTHTHERAQGSPPARRIRGWRIDGMPPSPPCRRWESHVIADTRQRKAFSFSPPSRGPSMEEGRRGR